MVFVLDKVADSIGRVVDKKQQRQYEAHEWEMSLGRERATLLRSSTDRKDPSQELVRGARNVSNSKSDELLRPQVVGDFSDPKDTA